MQQETKAGGRQSGVGTGLVMHKSFADHGQGTPGVVLGIPSACSINL